VQADAGTDVTPSNTNDGAHAVTSVHSVTGSHTVTQGWHGGGLDWHMVQSVVVITHVMVVQLVGQGTVEVMNTVTVPVTYAEVHVVQDCSLSLCEREREYVVSSSDVESAGAWTVASEVFMTTYRRGRRTR